MNPKISHNQSTQIRKLLTQRKYRQEIEAFVVEGFKNGVELLQSDLKIECCWVSEAFFFKNQSIVPKNTAVILGSEIQKMTSLENNSDFLAVVKMPKTTISYPKNDYFIVVDGLNDPGNLGTLVRIADWYNISTIICSLTTVDFYNPKAINSTKGSFRMVSVIYTDLVMYLEQAKCSIYGAYLSGESVHTNPFSGTGLLVFGNESHGISAPLEKFISHKITIPKFGQAESLNVAISAAIILDNLRKKVQ